MEIKEQFYKNYYKIHLLGRKQNPTLFFFEQKTKTWDKLYKKFLPDLKNISILEIGCGNGSLLFWLQRNGYLKSEGFDINPELVRIGRELGVKNIYERDLFEFLPQKNEVYDLIFLRDVLEHFNNEKIINVLNLIRNSLKSGGRLIIHTTNAESPFFGRIRYGDFTHETAFTTISLEQILKFSGYNSIDFFPSNPIFRGIKSIPRKWLWNVVKIVYYIFLYAEIGKKNIIVTQNLICSSSKTN